MKFMPGIPYLEISDFNPDNTLKRNVNQGKPVICMAQGVFCGYCTQAKPAFTQLAKEINGYAFACTMQIDSDKNLGAIISKLDPDYRGVPVYLLFDRNGRYVRTHTNGRDVQSLKTAIQSIQ